MNEFKNLMEEMGLKISDICEEFGIPRRTVEHWLCDGAEHRECPPYVLRMIIDLLQLRGVKRNKITIATPEEYEQFFEYMLIDLPPTKKAKYDFVNGFGFAAALLTSRNMYDFDVEECFIALEKYLGVDK